MLNTTIAGIGGWDIYSRGGTKRFFVKAERYRSELVRYIHLNPVRGGMVNQPEEYEYSSHAPI